MTDRIPDVPPVILPLTSEIDRPLWSVMIPTYNCITFLCDTIKSVLAQDLGEAIMQIEVVDDCSTDGNVAALVEEIGKGRVLYYRQKYNRGSLRNFETCLNRSKGQLVHLLHGDDRVEKGYYQEIQSLFSAYPDIGAAFTNFFYITGNTDTVHPNPHGLLDKPGVIKDFLLQIASRVLIQPPAIVVKRSVYEHLGSFYAVHYGEDWEMWTRIAAYYPIAYSPKHLASYRLLKDDNISHQFSLKGQNVSDIIKVIDIIQTYLPDNERKKIKKRALRNNSIYISNLAHTLYPTQKISAFIQAKAAWGMHKNPYTLYHILKLHFKDLIYQYKQNIKE